ncbi:MAG TPA: zf-HC2 domain-containing protein [Solirubrobacterales bacterium]|nr:zf-HC2 domain-containing protein [Solirubrobacterales bacterium]
MTTERCREWRESLGAHALGRLPEEERAALEAHLEGCPECRAEMEALAGVAQLLPLADPEHFGTAPAPPPSLADRVAATIRAERRSQRRQRLRLGLAFSGITAAVAAAALAIFVLPGGAGGNPEQHIAFQSLPPGLHIGATLEPHAYGTEIHMYVKGAPSGTLCRVFVRGPDGTRQPAGSFRYRWGNDSDAVLSAALDLSRTRAIGVRVGNRTFVAPVDSGGTA